MEEEKNKNINQKMSDIEIPKKNKKGKTIIIIISILLCLIISILLYIFIFNPKDKTVSENKDKIEVKNDTKTEETNNNDEKVRSDKYIYFYKAKLSDYMIAKTDISDMEDDDSYNLVDSYQCYSENCEDKVVENGKSLIYDNQYILYDINTKESKNIDLKVDNTKKINMISYDNSLYGLSVEDNEYYAYFDINSNKYVTDFVYSGFSSDAAVKSNRVIGYINTPVGDNPYEYKSDYYVIDVKSGNILDKKEDYGYYYAREYNGYTYYLAIKEYGPNFGPFEVYNNNFELVNEKALMAILSNGNYMIKNDDGKSFSIYDNKGNLVKNSKQYDEVKLIVDDYIAVIDNGYLKLIDPDGKEVANFTEWNDNMKFHTLISGYYKDNTTKVYGVYLVVEDNSIPEGTKGRGKEYYYGTKTKETGVIELEYIGGYAKPVLYLYPDKQTNVKVSFENKNMLTTTYPKFIDSWNVIAYPNGDLYDQNGKYYYALYWEEIKNHEIDFNEGFYVTGENAIEFLEEKLALIGLNERESNEFIMYWLPILESNKQSLVYFELTNERNAYNKININPKPDSILRMAMHVKKVNEKVEIKEQKLNTFKRNGFTAIEWGGVIH